MAAIATLSRLAPGDHVCVTHTGPVVGVVAGFVLDALGTGDKVVCYTGDGDPAAVAAHIENADARARTALRSGRFEIRCARDSYLDSGAFDPERTIDTLRAALGDVRDAGYPGLRVIADMSWAAAELPGAERLAWYEAETNRLFADGYARVACLYDRAAFTPQRLRECIAAHPATVEPDSCRDPQLRLRYTTDPPGLAIAGEADIANRAALAAVLAGLPHDLPGPSELTIDVSGMTFADVATAAALLRCAASTPRVRIAGADPHLADLLELVAQAV
jgi:hypothetical protein